MACRLSPPTLDIILAPLAAKERQRVRMKKKDHIQTETDTGGETHRQRSMETNSNTGKSAEQEENINTFPSPTALLWVGGGVWVRVRGGQTCQRLLTHVSRLPLGRLLED